MKKRHLSPEQAFRAMFVFLTEYWERTGKAAEIADVLGDIQMNEADGMPFDAAAWDDWLAAVNTVLADQTTAEGKMTSRRRMG